MPPVRKDEFWKRFHFGADRNPLLRLFFPYKKPCRSCHTAIGRLPKRIRRLEEGGEAHEDFWGLLAVEDISFLRIALYHSVILAGPFIFWFLWLFCLGHTGDLQNAAVPFSVMISLLSFLWFPLVHERGRR